MRLLAGLGSAIVAALCIVACGSGGTGERRLSACIPTAARHPAWQSRFDDSFVTWSDSTVEKRGTSLVTTPDRAGIPETPECAGTHVAEFGVTPAQLRRGDVDSKLYEIWDVYRARLKDDHGKPLARLTNKGAGVYSAWYYIPRDYRMRYSGPVNIFQFKESYSYNGITFAGFGQDMQSSLNLFSRRTLRKYYGRRLTLHNAKDLPSGYPMLAVNLWHDPPVRPRPGHKYQAIPAPLGRWFKVTAKLYPGNRVSYYVDDKLLDTWHNDEYPVGVRYPSRPGHGKRVAMSWVFGVGHYGANVGRLWVADASYTPFN